jgi:3D (Asp-Asp-Asp) domain-containing protein
MTLTNVIVSAYCACKLCCGPNATGLAANGRPPIQGVTVAASRSIPLGTPIVIRFANGVTWKRIVTDRLAKRYDSRVDIYFDSHQAAKNFGLKTATITIP